MTTIAFVALALGCSFAGGQASSGGATAEGSGGTSVGPTVGPGSAASTASTTGSATDSGGPTSAATSVTGATSMATTTDPGTGTTTGVFDCGAGTFYYGVVWADAATVVAPMQQVSAWPPLPATNQVVYGEPADGGEANIPFTVPCDRTYQVWGLVWDQDNCTSPDNADNFDVTSDVGPAAFWRYGCGTCAAGDAEWTWVRILDWISSGCNEAAYDLSLAPGPHSLTFVPSESGIFSPPTAPNVAAIAGLVITDDPDFVPSSVLGPVP